MYVNGKQVGSHRGGYDAFSFDVTAQLNGGTNELIVGVYDPTDIGSQPLGKQRTSPKGIGAQWREHVNRSGEESADQCEAAHHRKVEQEPSHPAAQAAKGAGV